MYLLPVLSRMNKVLTKEEYMRNFYLFFAIGALFVFFNSEADACRAIDDCSKLYYQVPFSKHAVPTCQGDKDQQARMKYYGCMFRGSAQVSLSASEKDCDGQKMIAPAYTGCTINKYTFPPEEISFKLCQSLSSVLKN